MDVLRRPSRPSQAHRLAGILSACLILAGCATSQTGLRMAESAGEIRLDTAAGPDHDFRVFVMNRRGPGFNGDKPEDRLRMATAYLGSQCESSRLVRERPLQTGSYLTGRPSVTWVMEMTCDR